MNSRWLLVPAAFAIAGCAQAESVEPAISTPIDDAGIETSPPEAAPPKPDSGPTLVVFPEAGPDALPTPDCGSVALQAKPVSANVVVVFDQSNSMNYDFAGAGPKWLVAKQAVEAALLPLQNSLRAGAVFYPSNT